VPVRPARWWRAVITPWAPMLAGGVPSDRRIRRDAAPANGVVSPSAGGASRPVIHNVVCHRPWTYTRSWVAGTPRRAALLYTTPGPVRTPGRAWRAYGQRRMAGAGPALAVVPHIQGARAGYVCTPSGPSWMRSIPLAAPGLGHREVRYEQDGARQCGAVHRPRRRGRLVSRCTPEVRGHMGGRGSTHAHALASNTTRGSA
jgi:hypothetical protein